MSAYEHIYEYYITDFWDVNRKVDCFAEYVDELEQRLTPAGFKIKEIDANAPVKGYTVAGSYTHEDVMTLVHAAGGFYCCVDKENAERLKQALKPFEGLD